MGKIAHKRGFAGVRRAKKQTALTETDRSDQIDQTHIRIGIFAMGFQGDPPGRINGSELIKSGTVEGFLFRNTIHTGNIKQGGVLVTFPLGADFSFDIVPGAQAKTADLRHGNM